jgi:hypothetical protein
LLELLIALFLLSSFTLPLAHLILKSVQEEYKSAYRLYAERLALEGLAKAKEKLYRQEIPWREVCKSSKDKALLYEDTPHIELKQLGKRTFKRQAKLWSVGKKDPSGEEWRLATIQIAIGLEDNTMMLFRTRKGSKKIQTFTYQLLLRKKAIPENAAQIPEGAA